MLLVEDNEDVLESTAGLLRELGATVTVAKSAEEAESKLHQGFDVVLADHRLPGRSGLDFLKAVRAELPDAQLALITGDPHASTLALRAGAAIVVVQKPVRAAHLVGLLKSDGAGLAHERRS